VVRLNLVNPCSAQSSQSEASIQWQPDRNPKTRLLTQQQVSPKRKKPQRRYSSDEVADIIRIGLQTEAGKTANTVDHDELISIGSEVGVSSEQIDIAVRLLEEEQQTNDKERLLWLKFKTHTVVFVGVNLLCITINLLTGVDVFWSGYVLITMGIFLLAHYAGLRYTPEVLQMAVDRTRRIAKHRYQETIEDDVNVEFSIDDDYSPLSTTEGLIFIEEDRLVIEHESVDSVLGIFKSGIKRAEIKLDDIAKVKLQPKFWSSELVLQGRSLRTFRKLPGNSAGTLYLKINKQSNTAALNLVDQIKKLAH
jgi:hypothetical protein